MRAKKGKMAMVIGVLLVGCASVGTAVSALDISGATLEMNNGGLKDYSLGWGFTPKENITVTKLGYYLAPGASTLSLDHVVTIYDSGGNQVVSGTVLGSIGGGTPVREADGYVYVDVADVPLTASSTYVIASYWTGTLQQWDMDVWKASAFSYASDYLTLGSLGLYGSSTSPCWPGMDASATYQFLSANFQFEVVPTTITVEIDIKPGNDLNPINQGANGVIPVAILTTSEFNAADVDPATVALNGAAVAVRGKSEKLLARMEDVDGDGDEDLLCQIDTESWADLFENGPVMLTGQTFAGVAIEGQDDVIIVPPEQ